MPGDYLELFWALLEGGNLEKLKATIPKDFRWNVLHPESKATILVQACHLSFDISQKEPRLDLIEWLVESGASYSQKSGESTMKLYLFKSADPEGSKLSVDLAGQSLMSYIKAWKERFSNKPIWKEECAYLDRVVDRIATACKKQTRPRASIDEGIVEFWEKFLQATDSHDLAIETSDGVVTCHSQMLMGASAVVQAMLGSPMKEGNSQRIHLEDTSSSAAQLFVEVLYTCSSQNDTINWKTALSALDLAHRWQVEPVVAILADLLQGMITEESFSAIAEQAALKGLDQLTQQCQKFGAGNAKIQKQIKKGQFAQVVRKLFQADPPKATAAKKRKRL